MVSIAKALSFFLSSYFGETTSDNGCGACDNCTNDAAELRDFAPEATLLLSAVDQTRGSFGLNMPIDVLRGSRAKKVLERGFERCQVFAQGKQNSNTWWKALADQLLSAGKAA